MNLLLRNALISFSLCECNKWTRDSNHVSQRKYKADVTFRLEASRFFALSASDRNRGIRQ
jgi:hypothetical protein